MTAYVDFMRRSYLRFLVDRVCEESLKVIARMSGSYCTWISTVYTKGIASKGRPPPEGA